MFLRWHLHKGKAGGGGPVSGCANDGDRGGRGAGRAGEGLNQGKALGVMDRNSRTIQREGA